MTKLTVAAGKNPPFDVVLLDEPWYSLLRVRGFIEELDPARVPNLKNVKKEFLLPDNAGVCLFSFTSGVVYNTKKFKELGIPPLTRYQDLANPKLSRRVGTQKLRPRRRSICWRLTQFNSVIRRRSGTAR